MIDPMQECEVMLIACRESLVRNIIVVQNTAKCTSHTIIGHLLYFKRAK